MALHDKRSLLMMFLLLFQYYTVNKTDVIKIELSVFNNITFTVVRSRFIWLYIAETCS
jgi:hypothetical protein